MSVFPKHFLWGAATSAHQVEGNNHNDWSEWEKLGRVAHGEQSGVAVGHYERWRDDLQLAQDLGHNAYRFSIEWSRVEPKPGVYDRAAIDHYRAILQDLRQRNMEPVVTLWHFTNPLWISQHGGWRSMRTVDAFGKYALTMVRELGSLVNYWVTINEPTVYSSLSHLLGYWPPEQKNIAAAWIVIRNLVKAHSLAYQIIHRHNPSAKVGVANNLSHFVPSRPGNVLDETLVRIGQFWHNEWWLDQTCQTQDFIGLNYYFHHPLKFKASNWRNQFRPEPSGNLERSDLGWDIHPGGLGKLLDFLRRYQRPIIITENGLADAQDHLRAKFITAHLQEISDAISRGVDVRGYLHWSLLDNFEWREGFDPRFGLIEVDRQTLKRTVRPSAYTYRDLIKHYSQ